MPQSHKKTQKNKRLRRYERRRPMKGGYKSTYHEAFASPTWGKGAFQWTTLVTVGDKFYGTSLPSPNFYEAYATLFYYFYVCGIKRILSLQGCITNIDARHCDGYIPQVGELLNNDRNSEKLIWKSFVNQTAKTIEEKDKYGYMENSIEDMTAGTLENWRVIRNIDFGNEDAPLLIHCLAGFGRTGSVLLYGILTEIATVHGKDTVLDNIKKPYMGTENINELVEVLMKLMEQNLHVVEDGDILPEFDKSNMINELFNATDEFHGRLLITRLNYIFLHVAHFCGANIGTQIYLLYMTPLDSDGVSTVESVPVTITNPLTNSSMFGFV